LVFNSVLSAAVCEYIIFYGEKMQGKQPGETQDGLGLIGPYK